MRDRGFRGGSKGGRAGGPVSHPLLEIFYIYKSEVYEQKISIKRVRNLSQNTRDSNFQNFLWNHVPRTP